MTKGDQLKFTRKLRRYAEPVSATQLKEGCTYFAVAFADDEMCVPIIQTLVYIGRNFQADEVDLAYFQDIDSYSEGIQYDSTKEDDHAIFVRMSEDQLNNIFEYEGALDVLIRCFLRRSDLSISST